jgi:demethylsterigmatocystin 6-O-methyltransferase
MYQNISVRVTAMLIYPLGARIYYMRNIIHDYPDDKAVIILKNTIAALAPDSVILIDDMVLPDSGAHWQATQLDLTMMTALASMERTQVQWYALTENSGLKINKIYTYTATLQDSIIECVPV